MDALIQVIFKKGYPHILQFNNLRSLTFTGRNLTLT